MESDKKKRKHICFNIVLLICIPYAFIMACGFVADYVPAFMRMEKLILCTAVLLAAWRIYKLYQNIAICKRENR